MKKEEEQALIDRTSADLAFELQFETLRQLTTLSVASIGFIATLFGSILKDLDSARAVWMALGATGLAVLISVSTQLSAVEYLFKRKPHRRQIAVMVYAVVGLLGFSGGLLVSAIQKSREEAVAVREDVRIEEDAPVE